MNKTEILSKLDKSKFYQGLIPSLKINGKPEALGLCPFHEDTNPSLSVNIETGLYFCPVCNDGGDLFKFYMRHKGVSFKEALSQLSEYAGQFGDKVASKIECVYQYTDGTGKVLFEVVRYTPKTFRQRRPDGKGGYIYNMDGVSFVPYNLPGVIASDTVYICEGEKDCDNLAKLSLVATTNPMGAGRWRDEFSQYFTSKNIVIVCDNDEVGKKHGQDVAQKLNKHARAIKVIEQLPGVPHKGDVSDWIKLPGNDKDKFLEIVKNTCIWTPSDNKLDILSRLERWDYIQGLNIKVEWAVDRLIPKEAITVVFGRGGIGKTWLLMDIAKCIGNGVPFLQHNTIKTPVIFVDFENPLAVLNTRTQKLGNTENVYFWRGCNEKLKAPKLDSKEWELFKGLPNEAVLIIDTLRASQSKDENASNDMALVMGRLKELRDMGFTIILLHHTAKNSDKVAKGSTAIVDLADHILGLTLVKKKSDGKDIVVEDEDDSDEDSVYRFGVMGKTRFEPYHIYLGLNPDKGFEVSPDPQEELLKQMHTILSEYKTMTKTSFTDICKKSLGIGKDKTRKLISRGINRYWKITEDRHNKNTHFVEFIQFSSFLPYIGSENWKTGNSEENTTRKLPEQKRLESLENAELSKFSGGCLENSENSENCFPDESKNQEHDPKTGSEPETIPEEIPEVEFVEEVSNV